MGTEDALVRPKTWVRRLVNRARRSETAPTHLVAKPKTWARRFVKAVAFVSVSLVTLLFVARMAWRVSGSNEWELVRDENGVKIYSLKAPGSDLIQVKGVVRVRSTLAGILTFMIDPATCEDYGCYDSYIIERVDDHLLYSFCRVPLPSPFQPRELVIRSQIHQNAQTKEVMLVNTAAPDKVPLYDCCLRVTDMSNTLRFTPLGNGQVEFEYVMNMDEGGYLPALLLNRRRPERVYGVLHGLQKLLDREKFRNAKLDFIQEK
jgi:START domain